MAIANQSAESMKAKELEVESILQEMNRIFQKYNLDTFYQNIKFITDFIYFEYYQRTGNQVRADFYHDKAMQHLDDLCSKHFMSFHVIRFLESKIEKFQSDGNIESLNKVNQLVTSGLDIDSNESYQFVSLKKFQAICKFYQRDYNGAARTINDLRNQISLKQHLTTDVECKLFQALQYCVLGEDGLCMQIISSLKRQIREDDEQFANVKMFIKIIKTALKPADYRKKIKKITEMWNQFQAMNHGASKILDYVMLDEMTIRKMTNPIKE
jgi:Fe2+ or Zn2+ uptake regulation protein